MAHELVRAGARDAVDGEAERGVLEGRVVAAAHEDAHELGDGVVAHAPLQLGGRHRRVAQTTGDRDRAVGVGRVLEESDLELGGHDAAQAFEPCFLAMRRWKRSTRPPESTSFCLPV